MPAWPEGRAVLERLNIEGFEEPRAGQFDSIRALQRQTERFGS
jgi:hypothetical protein